MLTSGDILEVDLGSPTGREAGFRHPAIVVTPQRILDQRPNVVHVVPLTTTLRPFGSEVTIEPDEGNVLPQRQPLSANTYERSRSVVSTSSPETWGQLGSSRYGTSSA